MATLPDTTPAGGSTDGANAAAGGAPASPGPGEVVYSGTATQTTLAKHGPRTVIGTPIPFEFRRSSVGMRREVGMLSTRPDLDIRPGRMHLARLGLQLARLGDTKMQEVSEAHRLVNMGDLTLADVAYLTTWRAQERERGKVLYPHPFRCAKCGGKVERFAAEVDMTTIPVRVYDPKHPLNGGRPLPTAAVGLREDWAPFGKPVKVVTLVPPKCSRALDPVSPEEWDTDELGDVPMVAAAIDLLDGEGAVVLPEQMDAMHEADFERLVDATKNILCGPQDFISYRHPACGHDQYLPLNWRKTFA